MAKKIITWCIGVIVLVLALIGLQRTLLLVQCTLWTQRTAGLEAGKFDRDLLYRNGGGEPLILVNPSNKRTLFFVEGFRAQMPAGMYTDWFQQLHHEKGVNVIVPVYGLQSLPFSQRNREWYFQEDARSVLQIYDAYTAMLPKDHRVVTASMSFGTLPHLMIAAKAARKPDTLFLLSPLNTGMEYKVAGELVFWLSRQTGWLQHLVLFSPLVPPPNRASVWDIVNRERNLAIAGRIPVNPEDSTRLGHRVSQAAQWMETEIVPQVKGRDIALIWGDSDLFFSQQGFGHLADLLLKTGNRVKREAIRNSGHMVLLDSGGDGVKGQIEAALK